MTDRPDASDESSPSATRYDGKSGDELARLLALPRVVVFQHVTSTLDVVHSFGEAGAPAGTLVLADEQTAGRGRMRRSWRSDAGAGIWLTLLERPSSDESLGVLALRIALALAPALDAFTTSRTLLKWPNDVYVAAKKLAGVLVEARWRGPRLDWLAIGVGINVRVPEGFDVAGLRPNSDRVAVLSAIVPALRTAASIPGLLDPEEIKHFATRDLAAGHHCVEPAEGIVHGIAADGALLVTGRNGPTSVYSGSLVLHSDVHSLGDSA